MLFSLYREHASAAGFSLAAAPPCSSPNYHQQLQPHNPGYLVPAWTPLILVPGPLAVFYPQDTCRDCLCPLQSLKCQLRDVDLESSTRWSRVLHGGSAPSAQLQGEAASSHSDGCSCFPAGNPHFHRFTGSTRPSDHPVLQERGADDHLAP